MMTYNRANSLISKSYTSMYTKNNTPKQCITETADTHNLNDITTSYEPLIKKINGVENGKMFFHILTKNWSDKKLYNFVSEMSPSSITYSSRDDLWTKMLDIVYSSGRWEKRTLKDKNILYEVVFPKLTDENVVNEINSTFNINIPLYTQMSGSSEIEKDGEKNVKNKKKVEKVEVPNVGEDVVNYYKEELDKRVRVSTKIRERIRVIQQLQSEMESKIKNTKGSQQGQGQGQSQQQMYDGRDWTPTTVPTYQQGHQGDVHHQQAPQAQQQKGQPQQQNAPKQDEEEDGFFSKIGKGLGRIGGGLVGGAADIGSAGAGAVKNGFDKVSNLFSEE